MRRCHDWDVVSQARGWTVDTRNRGRLGAEWRNVMSRWWRPWRRP
jgi:hypothetical protein